MLTGLPATVLLAEFLPLAGIEAAIRLVILAQPVAVLGRHRLEPLVALLERPLLVLRELLVAAIVLPGSPLLVRTQLMPGTRLLRPHDASAPRRRSPRPRLRIPTREGGDASTTHAWPPVPPRRPPAGGRGGRSPAPGAPGPRTTSPGRRRPGAPRRWSPSRDDRPGSAPRGHRARGGDVPEARRPGPSPSSGWLVDIASSHPPSQIVSESPLERLGGA